MLDVWMIDARDAISLGMRIWVSRKGAALRQKRMPTMAEPAELLPQPGIVLGVVQGVPGPHALGVDPVRDFVAQLIKKHRGNKLSKPGGTLVSCENGGKTRSQSPP